MPYYEIDPELAEEYGVTANDASGYDAVEATIDFARTRDEVRIVRDALVAKGFTSVRVRYDGGSDEGFSYFEFASVKGVRFTLDELTELFKIELGSESLAMPGANENWPERYRIQMEQQWRDLTPAQRVERWFDEFTLELANSILGEGYGTGEMSMRGQFRADLESGRLIDLEDGEE